MLAGSDPAGGAEMGRSMSHMDNAFRLPIRRLRALIAPWIVQTIWRTGTLPAGRRLRLCAKTGVAECPDDDVSDKDDGGLSNASKAFLVSAYQPVAAASPSGDRLQNDGLPL